METQIKKVGEDIKIVITIDANELANLIGPLQTELFIENKSTTEPTIENPCKGFRLNTIKFIYSLLREYGTEIWIVPNKPLISNLRWMHRVDDVARVFRKLEDRGAMDVEYNENKTRITRFKFKKNVQWT